jgi:hypothetical protein
MAAVDVASIPKSRVFGNSTLQASRSSENRVYASSARGAGLPELGECEQQAKSHKQNNQSHFGPVLWRQSPLASSIREKLNSHE